jgi:hypothetical protein
MKKVIYIIALLIGATSMAQTITVNGTPMLVSDDISFPFWLESGSSISPEVPVSSISVLEFNIVPNNNGNDMVFNQVISVTEGQTVPEGKTWKVESILVENQSFSVNSSNPNTFVPYSESGDNLIVNDPVFFLDSLLFKADLLPNNESSFNQVGFCYSYSNNQPTIYDNYIASYVDDNQFSSHLLFDSLEMNYVRAYVINDLGITYSSVKNVIQPDVFIGQYMNGGILFYLDESGEHGIVAALNDLSENLNNYNLYSFGCDDIDIPGADGQDIGTGFQNTQDIVNYECASVSGGLPAAIVANNYESNGYTDWYLPSIFELELVYTTIGPGSGIINNIGFFNSGYCYWSSSEYNNNGASKLCFQNGNISYSDSKGNSGKARAIRSF